MKAKHKKTVHFYIRNPAENPFLGNPTAFAHKYVLLKDLKSFFRHLTK